MSSFFENITNAISRLSFFHSLANKLAANPDAMAAHARQRAEIMLIESIEAIKPNIYLMDGDGLNPAFLEIEQFMTFSRQTNINEKFIFLLTEDFALRTGKKNDKRAGSYLDNFDLKNTAMSRQKYKELKHFLQTHLFGHPTTALCGNGYLNGLYGGWFCKRTPERIDILLSTGRFKGIEVNENQRGAVEAHIARRMMAALNIQEIRFYDFYPLSLDNYIVDKQFKSDATYRTYTAKELMPQYLLSAEEIIRPERRKITPREQLEVVEPPISKAANLAK